MKRLFFRLLAVVMTALLVLSCSACGGKDEKESSNPETAQKMPFTAEFRTVEFADEEQTDPVNDETTVAEMVDDETKESVSMEPVVSEDLVELPWENGGKAPKDYTWSEFEALIGPLQIAFQESFGSREAFEEWMYQAQDAEVKMPWDEEGKQPSEYTWDEFDALTGEQQMKFQASFGSIEAFDAWLQKAQGNSSDSVMPWEEGGKNPSEYTWDEFNALTGEQQMKFQDSFGSFEEFDKWLTANEPQ